MNGLFSKYFDAAAATQPVKFEGRVSGVRGILIESTGPQATIGEVCTIDNGTPGGLDCEVVGMREHTVQLMAYGEMTGLEIGAKVRASGAPLSVACAPDLLGRVLGPLGRPIDGKGGIIPREVRPVLAAAPSALERKRITRRLVTGVRAVDGLLAVGQGQRLGIFAGSGVGKSTFQGMVARNTRADVNVVALIGERGRELRDFLEKDLGEEGMRRSVIVVATGDASPLSRLRGAYVATTVAEYFRDRGQNVMLLFDSITRFARAMREISLAAGEPAAQRGYTPSVFDSMPKLLERCGATDRGTITGFYTVLVDGDDLDEPVSDTARGILDGHIVLSRNLAERGHYPAIDVLASISRLANDVTGSETKRAVSRIRRFMADYAANADLIDVGAYKTGANPDTDIAIAKRPAIEQFLVQAVDEKTTLAETLGALSAIAEIPIPDDEMTAMDDASLRENNR